MPHAGSVYSEYFVHDGLRVESRHGSAEMIVRQRERSVRVPVINHQRIEGRLISKIAREEHVFRNGAAEAVVIQTMT